MIRRTVVVSDIEPAPMSIRAPIGVDLQLAVEFREQDGEAIDAATLAPQFMLLSRTAGSVAGYDMSTDGGMAQVSIPGAGLTDRNGYSIEMYSGDALLATGTLALQGNAFRRGDLTP